ALRRRAPTQAAVPYALGNVYAEMQSWAVAVDAYAAALSLDPSYRTDPRLIGDLVEAPASSTPHAMSAKGLRTKVGAAAVLRVEQATRSAAPKVRLRAKRLRAQLLRL